MLGFAEEAGKDLGEVVYEVGVCKANAGLREFPGVTGPDARVALVVLPRSLPF
jgi:hypothetical protein